MNQTYIRCSYIRCSCIRCSYIICSYIRCSYIRCSIQLNGDPVSLQLIFPVAIQTCEQYNHCSYI